MALQTQLFRRLLQQVAHVRGMGHVADLAGAYRPIAPLGGYGVPAGEEELTNGLVTLEAQISWLSRK